MTKKQVKSLALVVITNTSLVYELTAAFRKLREELLPLMPNQDKVTSAVHTLDEMEALHVQGQAAIEQMKKEFGLEDSDPDA